MFPVTPGLAPGVFAFAPETAAGHPKGSRAAEPAGTRGDCADRRRRPCEGRGNSRRAAGVGDRRGKPRRPVATDGRAVPHDRSQTGTDQGSPSARSQWALDGVNFFLAGTLAGFGPFVAAFLGDRGWSSEDIGFVLSAGAFAALVAQLPGGELLDAVAAKRVIVAVGTLALAAAALLIALRPEVPFVFASLVLEGVTAGFITPAIAAGRKAGNRCFP